MAEEVTTPVETEAPEAEAQAPDLSEQFADLKNQLSSFMEAQEQPVEQYEPLDILGVDDYEDDGENDAEYEYAYDEPPADPRVDQIWDWASQQEQRRITDGLNALDKKYTDFSEKVPEIRDALDDMGIEDPAMRGNAALIERVYLALKAEADAAAETPAEEAASRGASRGARVEAPPKRSTPMQSSSRTSVPGVRKASLAEVRFLKE